MRLHQSGEEYPLVLFIPDASAVGKDWETPLQCGNGGTIWAGDEWQAEHPCFVVTMIYEDKYINDYNEYYESWLTGTMGLIRQIAEQYPVDASRIYTTGTSMGAMASMLMMEEDPDLFAAAYMVAGQWRDTEAVKDIKDENILFLHTGAEKTVKENLDFTAVIAAIVEEIAKALELVENHQVGLQQLGADFREPMTQYPDFVDECRAFP